MDQVNDKPINTSKENPNETIEVMAKEGSVKEKICDNNLTISTKLSTDQLICKTPQESPNLSLRTIPKDDIVVEERRRMSCCNTTLYLGILQILFGMLMSVFGVLVIVHGANLSQIGGGLWGGCLAVATGTAGVLTAAQDCCPLKKTAQRIAHTVFLALSLISLAVAQLVLVLAATGLGRDISRSDMEVEVTDEGLTVSKDESDLPSNYSALLSNTGLLVSAALECVCAAIASYQGARAICPCFRTGEENLKYDLQVNTKHAFVSSWLGKHSAPPLYVVAGPPSIGKHSKSGGLPVTPIFTLPPPIMTPPSIVGYPLIPAPLGTVPSPIYHAHPKEYIHAHRRYSPDRQVPAHQRQRCKSRSRSRSKSKERQLTTEELAKTYTGLDRIIAEEFIEICDSRNNSLCSESSCPSCCQCSSQITCSLCANSTNSSSDVNSRDYLVDNK